MLEQSQILIYEYRYKVVNRHTIHSTSPTNKSE